MHLLRIRAAGVFAAALHSRVCRAGCCSLTSAWSAKGLKHNLHLLFQEGFTVVSPSAHPEVYTCAWVQDLAALFETKAFREGRGRESGCALTVNGVIWGFLLFRLQLLNWWQGDEPAWQGAVPQACAKARSLSEGRES